MLGLRGGSEVVVTGSAAGTTVFQGVTVPTVIPSISAPGRPNPENVKVAGDESMIEEVGKIIDGNVEIDAKTEAEVHGNPKKRQWEEDTNGQTEQKKRVKDEL